MRPPRDRQFRARADRATALKRLAFRPSNFMMENNISQTESFKLSGILGACLKDQLRFAPRPHQKPKLTTFFLGRLTFDGRRRVFKAQHFWPPGAPGYCLRLPKHKPAMALKTPKELLGITRILRCMGVAQKIKQEGQTADVGPCFHLPGFHFGYRLFERQPYVGGGELLGW